MEMLDETNRNGHPLTEEQLAYFSDSERRAVAHALRRWRRAAVTGFLVLLIGIGFNLREVTRSADEGRQAIVQSGRVVSVAGCNRDFKTIQTLRGTLTTADRAALHAYKGGRYTADQYADSHKFYKSQLAKLRLPDCRNAATIVTDDPDDLGPVPVPLYPKGNG